MIFKFNLSKYICFYNLKMLKGLKVKKNKKDADEVDEVKDSPKSSSPILQSNRFYQNIQKNGKRIT